MSIPSSPSSISAVNGKDREHRPKSCKRLYTLLLLISVASSLFSFVLGCVTRYYFLPLKIAPSISQPEGTGDCTNSSALSRYPSPTFGSDAVEHVENMVHPAMLAHPNPRSVVVIGGKEHDADVQAILTEIFRHKSVQVVAVVASLVAEDENHNENSADRSTCNASDANLRVEYFDSLECLQQLLKQNALQHQNQLQPFDVVILLHPFFLFSDIYAHDHDAGERYVMELSDLAPATIQTTSQNFFMSTNGVLVTHLGISPYLNRDSIMRLQGEDDDEHLQLSLIKHMTDTENTQFRDLHIYEDPNGSGGQTFRAPQSYMIVCKDRNCRRNWYAEEAYMNFQIRSRLSSHPAYVDGATLRRFTRPSKGWESLYCSFPEHTRECSYMNGYDPSVPNVPREAFEVKQSSLGPNAGRGIFAKVDIDEGSYFMHEVAVHPIKFSVESYSAIVDTKSLLQDLYGENIDEEDEELGGGKYALHLRDQKYKYEIDALTNYMEGYGYDTDTFGSNGNFVDSGINTFMNHGCNKTFNFGPVFYVLDHRANITKGEHEDYMLSEEEADPSKPPSNVDTREALFNPLVDRHLENYMSSYEGSIRNISQGQELFTNYVFYYGNDGWGYGIKELRSQCRGETVGTVVQIEGVNS